MKREEFLKICGLLGLSIGLNPLSTLAKTGSSPSNFNGKVIIIGAGAAGLSCGYLLAQQGIDFKILEASGVYGGRMKRVTNFTDFPLPMGSEWLHVPEDELQKIVNDPGIKVATKFHPYSVGDKVGYYEDGELSIYSLDRLSGDDIIDQKFVGSSWFDFFEEYIVPSVKDRIQYNTPVKAIDYSGAQVKITDDKGVNYLADKLIFAAPLKMLQTGYFDFYPVLPAGHQKSIARAKIWSGIKVFMAFSEQFYPAYLSFADSETAAGQRLYHDAAFGQNSNDNVLGLFAVGKQAEVYQQYTGDRLRDYILAELDEIFDGLASKTFLRYIVQDWNKEPFIQAAYLEDEAPSAISRRLSRSVDDKLYFAGCSYTKEDDWSSVHTAARSARDAVAEILKNT